MVGPVTKPLELLGLELAERSLAGSLGQAADFEYAVVTVEIVEGRVGEGLAQRVRISDSGL